MAERLDRRDDDQLERALRALGAQLAYPPTPDLASAVRARLVAGRPAHRAPLRSWFAVPFARRLAYAFVALIGLVGALLIASPEARRAVADRLGVPGITIEYVTPTATLPARTATLPTTPPPAGTPATTLTPTTAVPLATPLSAGERLGLGRRITLDEARAIAPFPVMLPDLPSLGPPDEVYISTSPVNGQVAFVWLPRPELPAAAETGVGLLITQFQAGIDGAFIKKLSADRTAIQFVTVNGKPAYWLSGEPHQIVYLVGPSSVPERTRLAGNVLLWEQGGVTYRIEGPRTLEEALRIAASLR